MLDLKFIRDNPKLVKKGIKSKGEMGDVDEILKLDTRRRDIIQNVEKLKHQRNDFSQQVSKLKRENRPTRLLPKPVNFPRTLRTWMKN